MYYSGKKFPLNVNLGNFVLSASWAMDLANPRVYKHANRVAVSDIYQALREERPYRLPMSREKAFSILDGMVEKEHLDGFVVEKLKQISWTFYSLQPLEAGETDGGKDT